MKKIYFSLVVSILIFFAGEIFAQPQPPVLIDPCGLTNVELYPTFTWNPSANANRYHLQVFQGVNVVIDNSNITTPSYTVVSAVLTNNTTYYWQVRASSNGGVTWSGWSSTCTFTTVSQGPGIPNLVNPRMIQ